MGLTFFFQIFPAVFGLKRYFSRDIIIGLVCLVLNYRGYVDGLVLDLLLDQTAFGSEARRFCSLPLVIEHLQSHRLRVV